ncbi:hypothetical protein G6F55_014705 [Rhizopus delemar]|uniref:Uncharacterized protein n=1 Tax=Rhizopus oryzae TaxID=64495 RepID=A0A9P6XQ92_RHIOR|nr:hypothetical protein G6F55_014705 [Rhizopus delemar]KAG1530065.1 hypothetical protein G6F51_013956 [Rhizopus arrhizus]
MPVDDDDAMKMFRGCLKNKFKFFYDGELFIFADGQDKDTIVNELVWKNAKPNKIFQKIVDDYENKQT